MFYEDMSDYCYYLKKPLNTVQNVGWLDSSRKYKTGEISKYFLPKLACIITGNDIFNAQVNVIRGVHPCALSNCTINDVNCDQYYKANLGSSEVWIPFNNNFLATPTMVYHYIEKHHYLPPEPFIKAVMACKLQSPYQAQDIYLNTIQGHF